MDNILLLPIKNSVTRSPGEFSPCTLLVYILALSTIINALDEYPKNNII